MLRLPGLLAATIICAVSGMMCLIGLFIGDAIAKYLPSQVELLSNVVQLALAAALAIGS